MEILIVSAIAVATVPAMLFQTISNKTIQWIVFGLFLAVAFGTIIATPIMEKGQIVLGETALTKVNIIPISIGYLLALNLLVVPLLYWIDKRHANVNAIARQRKDRTSRIPEPAIHALTALGGAFGAFTSQQMFKHKRSKGSFQFVFLFTILTSMAIYYCLWLVLEPDMARVDAWFKSTEIFDGIGFSGR